jgi:hypothetical protein
MARILYVSHDNPRPSGGIRTLYRHVELLSQAGFDASIVHFEHGFRVSWFPASVSVLYAAGGLQIQPEDWVVIPEDHGGALEGFRMVGCRKAVFCQGHYQIFHPMTPQGSWTDYGVSEIIVSSIPIRDFVRRMFAADPTCIPLSLDLALFQFDPENRARQLQIAFMPRKGSQHLRFIQGILHHTAPELRDVAWVPIENRSEREVAQLLRESAFFLATGYQEGFGLPPLEAMACGTIVAGFRAGGGAEYATSDNGFWVADEDSIALADTLTELLRSYRRNPVDPRWSKVRSAGRTAAERYSQAAERDALLAFWSERAQRRQG